MLRKQELCQLIPFLMGSTNIYVKQKQKQKQKTNDSPPNPKVQMFKYDHMKQFQLVEAKS